MFAMLRLDAMLIDCVDSFCSNLQKRVHYVWMMTAISFGTSGIALAAALLLSRERPDQQAIWIALGSAAILFMSVFFWRTLWRDYRRWSAATVLHWMRMALMMRENGRIIRGVTAGGTAVLALLNVPFLIHGDLMLALMSYRFLFVSMTPILLLMYAFCARPVPGPEMLAEAARQLRRNLPDDPEA